MTEHKTATQMHAIARSSDEVIDRAVGAVLELAEAAARDGKFEVHVKCAIYAPAEVDILCCRLRNLGYVANEWTRMTADGENISGVLIAWGHA